MGFLLIALAALAFGDEGAARFQAHGCAACHRVGHRGGDAGPDLTTVGHRRERTWMDEWIAHPRRFKHDALMPKQGLTDGERMLLARYLSEQKGQAWGERRPWGGLAGLPAGRLIFARNCVGCHGPEGRGGHPNPGAHGNVIPALPALLATYTAAELRSKVAKGEITETHDGKPAMVNMPGWNGILSERELDDLTSYLLSIAKADSKSDF